MKFMTPISRQPVKKKVHRDSERPLSALDQEKPAKGPTSWLTPNCGSVVGCAIGCVIGKEKPLGIPLGNSLESVADASPEAELGEGPATPCEFPAVVLEELADVELDAGAAGWTALARVLFFFFDPPTAPPTTTAMTTTTATAMMIMPFLVR